MLVQLLTIPGVEGEPGSPDVDLEDILEAVRFLSFSFTLLRVSRQFHSVSSFSGNIKRISALSPPDLIRFRNL